MEKSTLIDPCFKKRLGKGSEVLYLPPSEDLKDGLYISLSNPEAEVTEDSQDSFSRYLKNIFLKNLVEEDLVSCSGEIGKDVNEKDDIMGEENEDNLGSEKNSDFNQEEDKASVVTHGNYNASEELFGDLGDQQSAISRFNENCFTSKKNVESFGNPEDVEPMGEIGKDVNEEDETMGEENEDNLVNERNSDFYQQLLEEQTSGEIVDIFGDHNELEMEDREIIQAYNERRKLREDLIESKWSKDMETFICENVHEKERKNIFSYKGHEIDLDKEINVLNYMDM